MCGRIAALHAYQASMFPCQKPRFSRWSPRMPAALCIHYIQMPEEPAYQQMHMRCARRDKTVAPARRHRISRVWSEDHQVKIGNCSLTSCCCGHVLRVFNLAFGCRGNFTFPRPTTASIIFSRCRYNHHFKAAAIRQLKVSLN